MNVMRWINLFLFSFLIVLLTACARKTQDPYAINAANAAYSAGPQASGYGDERNFGDTGNAGTSRHHQRTYYFDFDSTVVRSPDRNSIVAIAEYLVAHPNLKVLLEGHTDPRGSREYNIGLGERRARAVAEVLTARGVNPAQLRIVSYGAEKLASPGHSESAYQLDRRVVLVYLR